MLFSVVSVSSVISVILSPGATCHSRMMTIPNRKGAGELPRPLRVGLFSPSGSEVELEVQDDDFDERERVAASVDAVWQAYRAGFELVPEWNALIEAAWVGDDIRPRWEAVSQGYSDVAASVGAVNVEAEALAVRGSLVGALERFSEAAHWYGLYPEVPEGISTGNALRGLALGEEIGAIAQMDALRSDYPWGL